MAQTPLLLRSKHLLENSPSPPPPGDSLPRDSCSSLSGGWRSSVAVVAAAVEGFVADDEEQKDAREKLRVEAVDDADVQLLLREKKTRISAAVAVAIAAELLLLLQLLLPSSLFGFCFAFADISVRGFEFGRVCV